MRRVQKYVWVLLLLMGVQSMVSAAVWTVSPWTDDASTGIDSAKTYTHVINISDGATTTVNGVAFTNNVWDGPEVDGVKTWTLDGGGWINWDTGNNISGTSYEISTHFRYGNSNLVLTGLTPGGVYELTLFGVAWEDGTRMVTLTDAFGSFVFNEDEYGNNNGIKIVGIYSADANGELRLGVVNDFHIYGFANCEYAGDLPVVVAPIAPDNFEGGNRVETDTLLEWAEEFAGSLTNPGFDVYLDPNEAKVTAMDPAALVSAKQGTFSFDPVLDPNSLYYWRVATYLDMADTEPNMITDVRSFRTVYVDEHWSDSVWTDDADSGISAGKFYTHKVNFNASEAASTFVNGVYFENDVDRAGLDWTMAGALGAAGGGHNVTGDGGALVTNMYYGELPLAELNLTGLTPGQDYILTQYTRGWGPAGGRKVHFITSPDGRTTTLDGNIDGDGNGHLFMYAYTAPASGEMMITFDPITSDSWHHYAFSNEVALSAYVDPTPLPGASVNSDVELSWVLNGDVVGPTTYNLKVATDEAMTNLVVDINLSGTAHTPFLSSDTTYYWQVEIVDDGAVIYTSPVWNFVTTPPQDAVKVIEWKFDETTGIIAEQTGPTEDADGILIGFNDPNTPGVSHVPGLVNNGLLLNGKDEYVDVSNANVYMPTADGQSFAISGYIRTFNGYGPLFSMRNSGDEQPIIDIALGADGTQDLPGRICLLVRDDQTAHSNTNSGITVNDGRWHNFIVTRFEGKWTLYVDGVSRGTINGAATGDVTLDLMGIGASPRWLADNWNDERAYYRYVDGIVDEFTVWDGQLQPHQIAELAALVPPQGDIDFDLDTDVDDLSDFTADWLNDTMTPVQSSPAVLEDMESYTNDPNTYNSYWTEAEPDGYEYGTLDLSIIDDPNGLYGQVMQMDYDLLGNPFCHMPFRLLDRRINSSLFDTLTIRIKKLAGSEPGDMILDFYDGRDNVDPVAEGMHTKGRLTLNLREIDEDQWVTLEATLPNEVNFETCTDLFQIMVSVGGSGGVEFGTLLIDSIELTDATEDCVAVVGEMVPDMNGDCFVDMLDFAEIAAGWLNGM